MRTLTKFILTFALAITAFAATWANDVYVPITSPDQIDFTNGQEVILVYGTDTFSGVVTSYDYSKTGLSYFLSKAAQRPLSESIEIGGNDFPNVCTIVLQGTADRFTIKDGDNYIYAGNRNVWLKYSSTLEETNDVYYWKTVLDENSGKYYLANINYPKRPLKCQSATYTGSNPNVYGSNNASYPYAYLYVKTNLQSSLETNVNQLNIDGSGTFTVHGENLTNDVAITLSNYDRKNFAVSPKTIPLAGGSVNDVPVLVTYIGTAKTASGTIVVTSGSSRQVKVNYTAPDMFTTAGEYYVRNKGNNKYVVVTGQYDASASADNEQDADVITLAFDKNGIVTTMKSKYGSGDIVNMLETVKEVLKGRLEAQGYNTDFVDPMFRIRLINTGEENTIYFSLDVPAIENIDEIRSYLLNEGGINNELVKRYLNLLLQPGKRIYLNVADDNGTFGFTQDNTEAASMWMVEKYVQPVDNLFTEAGDYYVNNKGNNKYVVVNGQYDASASADNEQDADIITLDFDTDGFVTTMKQKNGSGDIISMLAQVKQVLTSRLQGNNMNADFVEDMFKIKLVKTDDNDGSIYFCFDIPAIDNINDVRNYLLNEGGINNQLVKDYLDILLQPGKRIYLNITDDNGTFGFTKGKAAASSKWMVEKYVPAVDKLFTEAGDYYVNNKGNNKYVVVNGQYDASASADNEQDADIITLDFDTDGFVTTMKQKNGSGDIITMLEQVKQVLTSKLQGNNMNADFVEDMFKIKLVKTDDNDGSIYFCFDIPAIDNINDVRNYLLNEGGINNQIVKDYLDILLQPGKRIYLNIADDNGTFGFTKDKAAALSKWMVESAEAEEDNLFFTAGEYLVSNKGNNKYVIINSATDASASVSEQNDASVITLAFDDDHSVSTMKNYEGDGDLIETLETVKQVLTNKLTQNNMNADFVADMFKIKLVETGDKDGSLYFCFDIPAIDNIDAIRDYLLNDGGINNQLVKDYLDLLLQPGKRIYLCTADENGTFSFTKDKRLDAAKWMVISVKQTDRSIIIYFDKETADQYDYYFRAWDETDGADNPYNYFENNPGVKVTSLPTTKIGSSKTVYEFGYRYKAKEPRLILTMGEGLHETAEITPKAHEIFYYDGGQEVVTAMGESQRDYQIGVPIDDVIFPDEGFHTFIDGGHFAKIIPSSETGTGNNSSVRYDNEPSNDVLEPWEIEKVESFIINANSHVTIKDFTGIEYLLFLKEIQLIAATETVFDFETLDLTMLCNNSLERIDVHGAKKMTTFELPEGHPLRSLELSSCNAMPVGTLNERLATYAETLEELTLSNCSNFAELDITQNNKLKLLDISAVPIPSLDLTGKNDLEVLRLSSTNITNDINVEIADKSQLKELYLGSNNKMTATAINVDGKPNLEKLQIRNQNNYETITVAAPNKLNYMLINENDNLASLNLPTLTTMQDMWIEKNPKLEAQTIDLTGNTSLKQINVNLNGAPSTIKGMSNQMTNLSYVRTEHQRYEGNVLDLSGCENLHNLDVISCNLDKLSVAGCKALGSKTTGNSNELTLLVYSNNLRALDLSGVDLDYNFNISPSKDKESYVLDGINRYFMPDSYMYHAGYNGQTVPTIKPLVSYMFYENYNPQNPGAKTYTYLVYVNLNNDGYNSMVDTDQDGNAVPTLNELFRQAAQERAVAEVENNATTTDLQENPSIFEDAANSVVDDLGFDYKRVKLWSRFNVQWSEAITKQNDNIKVVNGTYKGDTNGVSGRSLKAAGENPPTDVDPAMIKGDILMLGIFTVPEGTDDAKVSGKVSYMYDTRGEATMDTEYNGDFVDESEETNYYKNLTLNDYNTAANTASGVNADYDNMFPVEFNWEVVLSDKPEEVVTDIDKLSGVKEIASVTYTNMMGITSDRPFDGVNIVVTRYTDGSVTTTKILK